MKEYWDLFDKDNRPLGKQIQRGRWIAPNAYHRVVEGWIRTSDGKYLLQQRAKSKKNYPNYWSCTAIGSVLAGEGPEEAMVREMKEEMGIELDKKDLKLDRIISSYPAHYYVYKIEKDIDPDSIVLDQEEVQSFAFLSLDTLKEWVKKKKLTKLSYYHDFFASWEKESKLKAKK